MHAIPRRCSPALASSHHWILLASARTHHISLRTTGSCQHPLERTTHHISRQLNAMHQRAAPAAPSRPASRPTSMQHPPPLLAQRPHPPACSTRHPSCPTSTPPACTTCRPSPPFSTPTRMYWSCRLMMCGGSTSSSSSLSAAPLSPTCDVEKQHKAINPHMLF
eukprot:359124-Chlamydomonas_euryale.AAC.5